MRIPTEGPFRHDGTHVKRKYAQKNVATSWQLEVLG